MTKQEQRNSLGEALHTALRKLCDSKPTSIAWNLVQLLPAEVWGDYLDHVHAALRDAPAARRTQALRETSLSWDYVGMPARAALYCTFELFEPHDWSGYAGYLDELYDSNG